MSLRTQSDAGVVLALLAAVLSAGRAAAQSCQPCWSDQFLSNELNAVVHALAVFDADGAGPQRPRLHAGGLFLLAGGAAANFVARWDGTPREAVGGGPHRQKWTGAEWVPMGAGLNGPVWALWPFDEDGPGPAAEALYVGGSFTRAGGATANRIARWSGGTWAALSTGTNDDVRALTTFDVDADGPAPVSLMVGGNFTTAGGYPSGRIARWGLPAGALAPAITGQPQSATVCAGTPVTLSVAAVGSGPLTYRWRRDGVGLPNSNSPTLALGPVTPAQAGAYDCVVSNGCGAVTSDAALVTVRTPPVVTAPPQGRELCPGGALELSVSAAGSAPLSYQWRRDGVPLAGAVLPTYTVAAAGPADAGTYDCVVTNECGTAVSAGATVVVRSPVVITQSPTSQTVCAAAAVSFVVTATGTPPLEYRWRRDEVELPNATGPVLTLHAVTPADAGRYDVVVGNACGTVTSGMAVLSVRSAPRITQPPAAQTACGGGAVTFTVEAEGTPPLRYQWRRAGTPLAGATAAALTLENLDPAQAGEYDVVVANDCGSLISPPATLTVHQGPAITISPQSQGVCPGGTVTLTVAATGSPPLSYRWRHAGVVLAETGPTLTLVGVGPADAGSYDCLVSNDCGQAVSAPAVVTLWPETEITTPPQSQTACAGTEVTLSVEATAAPPVSYQWRRDGVAVPGGDAAILVLQAVSAADAGTYDVVVAGACGTAVSRGAMVTVADPVQIRRAPEPQSVCAGAAVTFHVDVAAAGDVTYQWRKDGAPLAGATAASHTIAAATPADAGVYDVVVTSACGSVTSAPARLDVGRGPQVVEPPRSQEVCVGRAALLSVTVVGAPPLTYEWRKDGVPLAGAHEPTLILAAVGPADAGAYDVRISGGCGDTVSPVAMLTLATGPRIVAPPQAGMVPAGSAVTLRVTAEGTPPLQYQWRRDGQHLPGATQAELVLSDVWPTDAGLYDVVVTNACGGLTSLAAELVVFGDDSDGDGVPDAADGCPNDPSKVAPGVCGCGRSDADSDGDGVADCVDRCAGTPAGMPVGADGCAAGDCDRNGLDDAWEVATGRASDCDGNGVPDACESDRDGDGVNDACDNCPDVSNPGQADADADGRGDACDLPDSRRPPPGEPQTLPDEIENPALGCGAGGACGAGLAGFLPATALGIGGLKLRMRRASRGG